MTRRTAKVAAALAALPLCAGAAVAQPQEGAKECRLARVGGYTVSTRADSVSYNHSASGGIDYRCADGTRIRSDSALVWEHSGSAKLVRRVRFEDAETELRSDTAYYFGTNGELRAWSRVVLTERGSGAVLMGDSLFYMRKSRYRKLDRIRVQGGNPRAVVTPAPRPVASPPAQSAGQDDAAAAGSDSLGRQPEGDGEEDAPADEPPGDPVAAHPYLIEAPRLYVDGRRFFRAAGGVVVTRDSLQATGDSLDYDQEVGAMLIVGGSRVVDRGFELSGAAVSVWPTTGLDEEIVAHGDAELAGDQVLMRAPSIRLLMIDGQVDRIVAMPGLAPLPGEGAEEIDTTGLTAGDAERARELLREGDGAEAAPDSLQPPMWPRPLARAADFDLTGDSIEVLSPNRVLESVTAVGGARAEVTPYDDAATDWMLPAIAARDWIEGVRIEARFAPADPLGEASARPATSYGEVRLESIIATTNARSLYRIVHADTAQSDLETPPDVPQTTDSDPDAASDSMSEVGSSPDSASAPVALDDPAAAGEEARPPALHYVSGDRITVHMEGRQVVRMDVEGRTTGYHFEPVPPDSAEIAADSVAPDSLPLAADSVPKDSLPLAADSVPDDSLPPDADSVPGATGSDDDPEAARPPLRRANHPLPYAFEPRLSRFRRRAGR